MVNIISSWARQVILAVLIAIILEMLLLKDSKTTKYIKTVIGIYVMYVIIAPGLNLLSSNSIDFSNIDYENFFTKNDTYKRMEENIESKEDVTIKETYELKIKQDIENKLREKGYLVSNIKLETNLDTESNEYGAIKKMQIKLSKTNKEDNSNESNEINVNKVEVDISENNKSSIDNKEDLKEFLSKEYGVDKDNIILK